LKIVDSGGKLEEIEGGTLKFDVNITKERNETCLFNIHVN
jgi:hypothetical protein